MANGIEAVGGTSGVQGVGRLMANVMLDMMSQLMQSAGVQASPQTQGAMQDLRNAVNDNLAAASRQLAPPDDMSMPGACGTQMPGMEGAGGAPGQGQGGVMQLLMELMQMMMQLLSALQQMSPPQQAGGEGGAGSPCDGGSQGPLDPTALAQALSQAFQQATGGPLDEGAQGAPVGVGGTGGAPCGSSSAGPSPFGAPPGGQPGAAPVSGPSGAAPSGPSSSGTGPGTTGSGSVPPLSTAPQTQALQGGQSKQVADQYVANLQKDFGLTKEQAAGVVGNLWHESAGMNSGINQGGRIGSPSGNMADDNANGYGIAQWGGVRKQGLMDYAHQHGIDPSSQAANYGYLRQELQGEYKGAIEAVKTVRITEEATKAFCNSFEKPSDPQMESRLQYAQQLA